MPLPRPIRLALLAPLGLLAAGCATVTRGTSQDVAFGTEPPGARCEISRDGALLAVIEATPQVVEIRKSKRPIQITCTKPGFVAASLMLESEADLMTAGNLVFGGLVGLAVDAGTGAMNRYESSVTLRLVPMAPPASAPLSAEIPVG